MDASGTELPATAAETTAQRPWPVRLLSQKIVAYIDRMSPLWVEGQIVQLNRRPGAGMAFLVLRDTEEDMSLPVSIYTRVLESGPAELSEGSHVVVHAKPTFWAKRGSFQMQASEIRAVGIGELLARIEELKRKLAAEGLFDAEHKQPLPFLPRKVGLICGRESKAEHDVVVNARARWPHIEFEIREVAVQGAQAVSQVSAAIKELDALAAVDVIVVARGGGAVEDLLPFSNESLVRVAAACSTPLVSAIGHETDSPLLDLVADYRASTPTDAARRIVPDLREEQAGLQGASQRMRLSLTQRLDREQAKILTLRSRPVLAQPQVLIDAQQHFVAQHVTALRDGVGNRLAAEHARVQGLKGQVGALSPQGTLERGYAVVRDAAGQVVREAAALQAGQELRVRVARGQFAAVVSEAFSTGVASEE